ncbi:MAG: hypothetical protein P4M08_09650 [Oligoflexia bacterium]|nr:hypothetical protein [Oligoflexia bacterium]
MKKISVGFLSLWVLGALVGAPAYAHHQGGNPGTDNGGGSAGGAIPSCMSGNQILPIDNQQVIQWKTSTANQYLARAHVEGPITTLYPDHSGHTHFEIELDKNTQETLEIIYNQSFGALPALQVGMQVEACGDYITSTAQSGPYPASPDGAILHWVHRNPGGRGHDSGFVAIDGVLYGEGNGNGNFQIEALFPSFEEALPPSAF